MSLRIRRWSTCYSTSSRSSARGRKWHPRESWLLGDMVMAVVVSYSLPTVVLPSALSSFLTPSPVKTRILQLVHALSCHAPLFSLFSLLGSISRRDPYLIHDVAHYAEAFLGKRVSRYWYRIRPDRIGPDRTRPRLAWPIDRSRLSL